MATQNQQQAAIDWIRLSDDPDLAVCTAEHLEDDLRFVLAAADRHPTLRPGLTPVVRRLIRELTGHLYAWREEAAADEELLRAWE
jgi:hypothetical protein